MKTQQDDLRQDEVLREEAAAWLARLRGECSAQDHAAFEDWYAADADHAAAYDAVLASWESTESVAATPAGRARRNGQAFLGHRRYAIAAAAASLVIALLAFGAFGSDFTGKGRAEPADFASPADDIRVLALGDGSHARLGADSALRSAYSAGERRVVLLRGRARFDVAHDENRPFIVAAGTGLIVARGTVFDVALNAGAVTVVLIEGSVEVRSSQGVDGSAARQILAPGESAVLEAGRIETLPPPRGEKPNRDGPDGMLSFESAPLGRVVEAANRYDASRIVLADAALARLRFTGTFEEGANEQLAGMIAETFALHLSRSNGTFVLAPAREAQTGK